MDNEYNDITDTLIKRYVNDIVNKEATSAQVEEFWQDVNQLPPEHRDDLKSLCKTCDELKEVFRPRPLKEFLWPKNQGRTK